MVRSLIASFCFSSLMTLKRLWYVSLTCLPAHQMFSSPWYLCFVVSVLFYPVCCNKVCERRVDNFRAFTRRGFIHLQLQQQEWEEVQVHSALFRVCYRLLCIQPVDPSFAFFPYCWSIMEETTFCVDAWKYCVCCISDSYFIVKEDSSRLRLKLTLLSYIF